MACNARMSTVLDICGSDPGDALDQAAEALAGGALVAVPTETVYGLAADATNPEAVAKIYAAKGRPTFNPLIIHVSGPDMAQRYGGFDDTAERLIEAFWPGPLTLVVPMGQDSGLAEAVTANLETVAIRQPTGAMADLARRLGRPLAAPSANSSGRISPTRAEHVAADLGDKVALILDGGPCAVGLESTIVKCAGDAVTLLREGGLDQASIEAVVGPLDRPADERIEAPGMLLKHYAPSKPVRLNADHAAAGEALLGFGPQGNGAALNLSPSGDLAEAARNLFAMLHDLDGSEAKAIAVQPVPNTGLGAAINDRLRRAAAGVAEE